MGRDQPLTARSIEPNEDLLRSFLLDFRKFISKEEPVYIGYIHGLCHKCFTSDELKDSIRRCQEGWMQTLQNNGVKLVVNGKEITPELLGDLWINGHYFHHDPEKVDELKRYLSTSFIFARHEFIAYVLEATRVIGGTGFAIKAALRDGSVNC